MKKTYITDFSMLFIFWISIVLGELIFHKIYLDPVGVVDLYIISIPIYSIASPFMLKFVIFDLALWNTGIKLFITRKYYGFPYPKLLCPFFAIFTIFDMLLVIINFIYSFKFEYILLAISSLQENFVGSILKLLLKLFTFDYSIFLPAVVLIVNWSICCIIGFLQKNEDHNQDEIIWQKSLIMPGEKKYDSQLYYKIRFNVVLICYIVLYRFIVLMNIRLSYGEIIGILLGLMVWFYTIEHYNYSKQMDIDKHYLYDKIAGQLHFQDGMNWKDLVDFQILEIQRLKEIEKKFNTNKIRNIRWMELYEHAITTDTKSIYTTILNLEGGRCDIQEAIDEIKSKILSIEKMSVECMPILPNSRKLNPAEIDFMDLIEFFQTKIPLVDGEFCDEAFVELFKEKSLDIDNILMCTYSISFSDLENILYILGTYLLKVSGESFICKPQINDIGYLSIELNSSVLDSSEISFIRRKIKQINKLWDESQRIEYCYFPIELAVAQAYMKDNNGDMKIEFKDNRLIFSMIFFPKDNLEDCIHYEKNHTINIGEFLEEYTSKNKSYTPFHSSKEIFIEGKYILLKEILDHFADYSYCRKKENSSVIVSVEEDQKQTIISLKFPCDFSGMPLKQEIQETLQYWHNSRTLVPEHSSLSLLMMKIKMEKMLGSIDLNLENDYFLCKLVFTEYKPK